MHRTILVIPALILIAACASIPEYSLDPAPADGGGDTQVADATPADVGRVDSGDAAKPLDNAYVFLSRDVPGDVGGTSLNPPADRGDLLCTREADATTTLNGRKWRAWLWSTAGGGDGTAPVIEPPRVGWINAQGQIGKGTDPSASVMLRTQTLTSTGESAANFLSAWRGDQSDNCDGWKKNAPGAKGTYLDLAGGGTQQSGACNDKHRVFCFEQPK
jgi:hypothetical protein